MKKRLAIYLCLLLAGAVTSARAADPAHQLIERVLPERASEFTCETIPADNGKDVFEIEAKDNKIVLRGNNGVSQAMAFNWYLRYYAHTSYDWQATGPLEFSGALPVPPKIHQVCLAPERFFLNYCTFGYTFPFTDFTGWQRFIDWMAMNGINRPLLQCGQDAVWLKVWKSYGLSDEQVRSYFTGPAHLPWHHMANIDKWGGPLPMAYIDGQMKLQQQILASTRALGMKPILCGFAGHVPEELKAVKPDAKITHIKGNWGGFADQFTTWFLDPTDPLFKDIQLRLLKEQAAMYGTDHLYAADPFNEMTPPSWEGQYMARVAKSIYDGMAAGDPDAIWYQMAWTFHYQSQWITPAANGETPLAAMTKSVPSGKMVFLDYYCEEHELYPRTKNFYGAPYIWNYLGNFGGCTYMAAPVTKVADRIEKTLAVPNCVGVGSTLEGLNVNPVIYELTLEQPWHPGGKVDYAQWCADYGARRGNSDPAVISAWQILVDKVLTLGDKTDHAIVIANDRGGAVNARPKFDARKDRPNPGPAIDAPPARPVALTDGLVAAADELMKASPRGQMADGFRYDAVNIVRQLMVYQSDNLLARLMAAYRRHDQVVFRSESARYLELIHDMDKLLGTRHEYLLGAWIKEARAWGDAPVDQDYYEKSARQILTTWGGPGAALTDYARREWNGMLATYYLPRWDEFIKELDASLTDDKPFDFKAYTQWRIKFEGDWVDSTGAKFIAQPQGDPVDMARKMLAKYRAL